MRSFNPANHKPLLFAAVIAVGLIAALSTFASGGPKQRTANCVPTSQPSYQPETTPTTEPTTEPTIAPTSAPTAASSRRNKNKRAARKCSPGGPDSGRPLLPAPKLKTSWSARGKDFVRCFTLRGHGRCETNPARQSVFSERNYQVTYKTVGLRKGSYNLKIDYRNAPLRRGYKVPKNYKYKVNILVNGKVVQRVELKSNQKGGRGERVVRNLQLKDGSSKITLQYVNDSFVRDKSDTGLEISKVGLKKR